MPQLPYSGVPSVQPQGPAGVMEHAQASPQDFGSGVGQAEEGLANTGMKVSDMLAANAQRLQELSNDRDANQAINKYMEAAGDEWAKFGAMQGQQAADYRPTYQANLSTLREQFGASLQSPMARQQYDDNSRFMTTRYFNQGASHAAEGQKQSYKTTNDDNFESAVKVGILGQNDPPTVALQATRAMASARQNAFLKGKTDDQAESDAMLGRGMYFQRVLKDMLDKGSVGQASQMYQTVRPTLDGNSILQIDGMMKPIIRDQAINGWIDRKMGGSASGFVGAGGGGGGSGRQIDDATAGRARDVYDGLVKRGMDSNTALGFAASAVGESAAKTNNTGDGGAAHGMFMWRNSGNDHRLDDYVTQHGHLPEQGNVDEQLDHIMWELGGRESPAKGQIASAGNSPAEKAAAVSQFFERPQDKQLNASVRSDYANQLAKRFGIQGANGPVGASVTQINTQSDKSPAEMEFPDEQGMVQDALKDFDDPYEQQKAISGIRTRFATLNAAVRQDRDALGKAIPDMEAQALGGQDINLSDAFIAKIRHVFPPEQAAERIESLGISQAVSQQFAAVKFGTPENVADAEARLSTNLGLGGASPETAEMPDLAGSNEAYRMRQNILKKFQTSLHTREAALNGKDANPAAYIATSPIIRQSLAELGAPMPAGATPEQQQAIATQRAEKFAQTSVSFQQNLGVRTPHVLTREDAQSEAIKINSAGPDQDVGKMLADKQKAYGQAWPQVFGDLTTMGGLAPEYQTLAQMPSQTARSDFQSMLKYVSTTAKNRENMYDQAGKPSMDAIKSAVLTDPTLTAFEKSAQVPGLFSDLGSVQRVRQAVTDLAAFYSLPGGGSTASVGVFGHKPTAVERAVSAVIGDKYSFDTTDNYLRVPNSQATLKQVQDYGDGLKENLTERDLLPTRSGVTAQTLGIGASQDPEVAGRIQRDIVSPIQQAGTNPLRNIQQTGKWVTNESDSGAYLVAQDENGRPKPVRKADGSRVEFSWKQAKAGPPLTPAAVQTTIPPI